MVLTHSGKLNQLQSIRSLINDIKEAHSPQHVKEILNTLQRVDEENEFASVISEFQRDLEVYIHQNCEYPEANFNTYVLELTDLCLDIALQIGENNIRTYQVKTSTEVHPEPTD